MTDYNSLEEAFNRLALITERDALAQQLADCQVLASGYKEQCDSLVNVAFDRDKQLADAVKAIKDTRRSLQIANDSSVIIDTIWLDSPASETLFDYLDAFLTTIEQDKAND